ncbi:flippase [Cellvibrio sp.]|uniref:flippase n=1 Tax=Cellvibrio sp. TaxID=1965322 RepID=UPI0039647E39
MINRRWVYWLPEPIRERLKDKTHLQAILANYGWLIIDKVLRVFLGLFVGAWIARYLGPDQIGDLAYALAYIAIFQAAATLGMDAIIVRDISKNKAHSAQLLGTCFSLRITFGIVLWISAILIMGCLNGWTDRSVWIITLAGGGLIFQAADTIDLWFQSQSKSRYTVTAKLAAYLISNTIKIALIINKANLLTFALFIGLESLLAAIGLALAYQKFPCSERWKSTKATAKRLLGESWPLLLSSVCIMLYIRIDQIMIKEILGTKELGIYSTVIAVSSTCTFIPMLLSVSLSPYIAQMKNKSPEKYNETICDMFIVFAIIGWISSSTIFLASPYIVSILFGKEYISGTSALAAHAFTNIFICMGIAQSIWLINEGKAKLSIYQTTCGLATCVLCSALLIPLIGILGAAISTVLANLVSAIASNFIFSPRIAKQQISGLFFINAIRFNKSNGNIE